MEYSIYFHVSIKPEQNPNLLSIKPTSVSGIILFPESEKYMQCFHQQKIYKKK